MSPVVPIPPSIPVLMSPPLSFPPSISGPLPPLSGSGTWMQTSPHIQVFTRVSCPPRTCEGLLGCLVNISILLWSLGRLGCPHTPAPTSCHTTALSYSDSTASPSLVASVLPWAAVPSSCSPQFSSCKPTVCIQHSGMSDPLSFICPE
jgi:hypothetical protein